MGDLIIGRATCISSGVAPDPLYNKPNTLIAAEQIATLTAERDALRAQVMAMQEDKERLDFLDQCNAALNDRYGTNYGWDLILNHNVTRLMLGRSLEVDLHDSAAGVVKLPSCRAAIDRRMKALR